jgi:hypothetical protein
VLRDFSGGSAEKLLGQIVAAADLQLSGEDAESVFRRDEVDAVDAGVGDEGAKHLGGIDGAAGAGDGKGDIATRKWNSFSHINDYL